MRREERIRPRDGAARGARSSASKPNTTCSSPDACRGCHGRRARAWSARQALRPDEPSQHGRALPLRHVAGAVRRVLRVVGTPPARRKEEGRSRRSRAGNAAAARRSSAPPADAVREAGARAAPRPAAVVAEAAIRDPTKESERSRRSCTSSLSPARKAAGEQPMPFDRFAQVVKAQVSKLGADRARSRFASTWKAER